MTTAAPPEPELLTSAHESAVLEGTGLPGSSSGLLAQVAPWLGHAGCFVGAGLVSGGIVHHPLDPSRYTLLAGIGVLVFLVATMAGELLGEGERPGRGALLRVAGGSLLLALGIGMLSGGIQHFADVPDRAVVLVPAGLLLSWLAFQLRSGTGLKGLVLSRATGGIAVLALGLFVGLPHLAPPGPAEPHGHSAATAGAGTAGADAPAAGAGTPVDAAAHPPGDAEHAPPGEQAPTADPPAALDAAMAELEARMAELAG